jgi:hypothetical protein
MRRIAQARERYRAGLEAAERLGGLTGSEVNKGIAPFSEHQRGANPEAACPWLDQSFISRTESGLVGPCPDPPSPAAPQQCPLDVQGRVRHDPFTSPCPTQREGGSSLVDHQGIGSDRRSDCGDLQSSRNLASSLLRNARFFHKESGNASSGLGFRRQPSPEITKLRNIWNGDAVLSLPIGHPA